MTSAPVVYNPSEARIAEVRGEVSAVIGELAHLVQQEDAGPIKKALKIVVPLRTELEEWRVQLKAPHLEAGKNIDNEAKRLKAVVWEFEGPLQSALAEIEGAEERRAREKVEADLKAEEERRTAKESATAAELAEKSATIERQNAELAAKADELRRLRELQERGAFEDKRQKHDASRSERKAASDDFDRFVTDVETLSFTDLERINIFGRMVGDFIKANIPTLSDSGLSWWFVSEILPPMRRAVLECREKR